MQKDAVQRTDGIELIGFPKHAFPRPVVLVPALSSSALIMSCLEVILRFERIRGATFFRKSNSPGLVVSPRPRRLEVAIPFAPDDKLALAPVHVAHSSSRASPSSVLCKNKICNLYDYAAADSGVLKRSWI
jgi:hypothetical protein